MNVADQLAKVMLEDDATPEQPSAQPDAAAAESPTAKWDKAHGTWKELRALHAKRDALFQEIGFSLTWARALAHVGLTPKDARGVLRAQDTGSTDMGGLPHGSAARLIYRTYAKKYPNAVVGAHLVDGGVVFFKEPIAPRGGQDVPTYEEFKAGLDKRRADEEAANEAGQGQWRGYNKSGTSSYYQ